MQSAPFERSAICCKAIFRAAVPIIDKHKKPGVEK